MADSGGAGTSVVEIGWVRGLVAGPSPRGSRTGSKSTSLENKTACRSFITLVPARPLWPLSIGAHRPPI